MKAVDVERPETRESARESRLRSTARRNPSRVYSVTTVFQMQESLRAEQARKHDDPEEWEMGDPRNGDTPFGQFRDKWGAFVNHPYVSNSTMGLIIVNSILMGVMTFDFVKDNSTLEGQLNIFDTVILGVFTVEFALQAIYLGWETRKNAWIVFDGTIALMSWAFMGSSVKILRSFRIFRIFALVARVESLKTLFTAVIGSLPQMGNIWLVLSMFFYVFAVLYTNLYAELYDEGFLDWDYFGRLDRTLITLFQFMTLDSWTGVVRQVMDAEPLSVLGFIFFVLISAFIILSLMIAVVCESLMQANDDKKSMDAEGLEKERIQYEAEHPSQLAATASNEDMIRHLNSHTKLVQDIQGNLDRVEEEVKGSLETMREEMKQTQDEVKETLKVILSRLS